ncbi:unnamed protein product [Rhizoctonia solani]|uniref:Aminoglycoside phosphotransferase domain-containing protein n=1 Tax=Rhizoctonia solani TaxID=456999 RepID=A0A8H2WYS8_9AGAM|nr:unnamed protein product [Rhizoctonia solani]
MHDLKSPEGVITYLKGTRFAASSVHRLVGGVSAFTYRVLLEAPLDTGEHTIVIKHFEEYLANHEEMKWGIERADHEYKALAAINNSGLFDSDSIVQLPRPLKYDQETHTIFMTDLGSPIPLTQVLEKGFPKNQTSVSTEPNKSPGLEELYKLAAEIGQALGDFLGRFHTWSALPQQTELRAYFLENPGVVHKSLLFHHFCFNFSVDRFKIREAWMNGVLAKEQQELEASTDPGAMIMGDCSLPTTTSFALIYHPNINHPFVPALHESYRQHRILDPRRLGITTGIDLLGLGTFMPWTRGKDEESLRDVATAGFELLNSSVTSDEHIVTTNRIVQHLFPPSHDG